MIGWLKDAFFNREFAVYIVVAFAAITASAAAAVAVGTNVAIIVAFGGGVVVGQLAERLGGRLDEPAEVLEE